MFSALCRRLLPLALGAGFVFSAPAFSAMGETANTQARHIATVFPGRMTGSPR
ncbi:alkaline phosphatase isozyme conversion aminopeptidase [Raoultella planticola]|nr:alkaline phosphatase isozyme conversion aminopeptidase [Raoultella planticola]